MRWAELIAILTQALGQNRDYFVAVPSE